MKSHSLNLLFIRIKSKVNTLFLRLFLNLEVIRKILLNKKKIYLFACPIHRNLGDQAQTYSIEKLLSEEFSSHKIINFSFINTNYLTLFLARSFYFKGNMLIFHSGYLLVDHHTEINSFSLVTKLFKKKRILILPQTINILSERIKEKLVNVNNQNITLLCRDEVSYEKAKILFPKCSLLLFPDLVTLLVGKFHINNTENKQGILILLRNDKESLYKNEKENLIKIN